MDDPELQARLVEVLDLNLADDTNSWVLSSHGSWKPAALPYRHERAEPASGPGECSGLGAGGTPSPSPPGCLRSQRPEPSGLTMGSPGSRPCSSGRGALPFVLRRDGRLPWTRRCGPLGGLPEPVDRLDAQRQVTTPADRDREPEIDQSVREDRNRRHPFVDTESAERRDEDAFDHPESTRCDRDAPPGCSRARKRPGGRWAR